MPAASLSVLTVLRVYENGREPSDSAGVKHQNGVSTYNIGDAELVMRAGAAVVRRGGREWTVKYAQ
jgi:hypothetical protein